MLRLTLEREKRNLSKAGLARIADMGAPEVGKIEALRARPYASQLAKLAAALGVPAEALMLEVADAK